MLKKVELALENITIGYDKNLLIEDSTTNFYSGEKIILLGANGSGKTSLLRVLFGYQKPLKGKCLLSGAPIETLAGSKRAELVRYVPQQFKILPEITVKQFKETLISLNKNRKNLIEELLISFNLNKHLNSSIKYLSGGECRRLFLMAALLVPAPILLLDEPYSFLDTEGQAVVAETIINISNEHPDTTVILTAHSRVTDFKANRIIQIQDRKLIEVAA